MQDPCKGQASLKSNVKTNPQKKVIKSTAKGRPQLLDEFDHTAIKQKVYIKNIYRIYKGGGVWRGFLGSYMFSLNRVLIMN